jgi:hypothetical protein
MPLAILFPLFGDDEEEDGDADRQPKKAKKAKKVRRGRATRVLNALRPWSWVAFNVALLLFFGYLHQAGVVPSLLSLSASAPQADVRQTLKPLTLGISG